MLISVSYLNLPYIYRQLQFMSWFRMYWFLFWQNTFENKIKSSWIEGNQIPIGQGNILPKEFLGEERGSWTFFSYKLPKISLAIANTFYWLLLPLKSFLHILKRYFKHFLTVDELFSVFLSINFMEFGHNILQYSYKEDTTGRLLQAILIQPQVLMSSKTNLLKIKRVFWTWPFLKLKRSIFLNEWKRVQKSKEIYLQGNKNPWKFASWLYYIYWRYMYIISMTTVETTTKIQILVRISIGDFSHKFDTQTRNWPRTETENLVKRIP